jgi:hypothetical protein
MYLVAESPTEGNAPDPQLLNRRSAGTDAFQMNARVAGHLRFRAATGERQMCDTIDASSQRRTFDRSSTNSAELSGGIQFLGHVCQYAKNLIFVIFRCDFDKAPACASVWRSE